MAAAITSLFDNDVLTRVERLRLNSVRRFTNKMRGEHLSGKGGSSTEFSDYRDYVEGDDVRFVDWNIFSRLHRPYLKLYHVEEEQHVVILLDASSSMLFEDKLLRARQLAAAFGVMGLMGQERVSVWPLGGSSRARLEPCAGRANLMKLFAFLEGVEGGGDAPIDEGIESMLKYHSGRGMVVVLSDFLTAGDLKRTFNLLYSKGLEMFAIQILGPTEINPELSGDVRFVDCENRHTLDVSSAGDLLALYQEYRQGFARDLETICRTRSGRFLTHNSQDPLAGILFDVLRRKGWVV